MKYETEHRVTAGSWIVGSQTHIIYCLSSTHSLYVYNSLTCATVNTLRHSENASIIYMRRETRSGKLEKRINGEIEIYFSRIPFRSSFLTDQCGECELLSVCASLYPRTPVIIFNTSAIRHEWGSLCNDINSIVVNRSTIVGIRASEIPVRSFSVELKHDQKHIFIIIISWPFRYWNESNAHLPLKVERRHSEEIPFVICFGNIMQTHFRNVPKRSSYILRQLFALITN